MLRSTLRWVRLKMAETAELFVDISLKGNFGTGIAKAQKATRGFAAETKKASTQVGKMQGAVGGLGKRLKSVTANPQLKQSLLTGVGLGGGVIGFQLLTSAITGTISVLSDAVRAAAEEEAAIAQLTRAIQENDEAWNGNIDAVEALITKRQELAFADSEQREALRLLVSNTKDVTKAQELLATAMDFARLRGIALRTSADLLGRAYQGQFSTLSRYGVVLGKGATATEALAAIQKMAEGQAQAYAETTQGQLVRAQIAMGDAMEDLGRVLTPVATQLATLAADTLPMLVQQFKDWGDAVGETADKFGDLRDAIKEATGRDVIDDLTTIAGLSLDNVFGGPDNARAAREFTTNLQSATRDGELFAQQQEEIGEASRQAAAAVEGAAGATETAAQAFDAAGFAAQRTAFALSGIAAAAAKAKNRADRLADGLNHVATVGFGEVRKSANEARKAIEAAFKGDDKNVKSVRTLQQERDKLEKQQRRAALNNRSHAFALASARLAEVKTQLQQRNRERRATKEFRDELKGRKSSVEEVTTTVEDLGEEAGKQKRLNIKTDHAMQNLNAVHKTLVDIRREAMRGVITLSVLKQRAATVGLKPSAGPSFGGGTQLLSSGGSTQTFSGGIAGAMRPAPVVNITNTISAYDVEGETSRVLATNRRVVS